MGGGSSWIMGGSNLSDQGCSNIFGPPPVEKEIATDDIFGELVEAVDIQEDEII